MTEEQKKELINIFSCFPQKGKSEEFPVWVKDRKLAKNLETYLDQLPSYSSPEEYANEMFSRWQQNPANDILKQHILAYLARICFSAAKSFVKKYKNYGMSVEDYFQTAQTKVNKILTTFNPELGSLYSYANNTFVGFLKDYVRKECDPSAFRTDIWLLNCKNLRQTKKALQEYGLSSEEVEKYILVREYFNKLTTPTKETGYGNLPAENSPVWQQIAIAYNQEKPASFPQYNQEDILKIIKLVIKAIVYCYFNNKQKFKISEPHPKPTGSDLIPQEDLDNILLAMIQVITEIKKVNKAQD